MRHDDAEGFEGFHRRYGLGRRGSESAYCRIGRAFEIDYSSLKLLALGHVVSFVPAIPDDHPRISMRGMVPIRERHDQRVKAAFVRGPSRAQRRCRAHTRRGHSEANIFTETAVETPVPQGNPSPVGAVDSYEGRVGLELR